jgi:hypothetical protein
MQGFFHLKKADLRQADLSKGEIIQNGKKYEEKTQERIQKIPGRESGFRIESRLSEGQNKSRKSGRTPRRGGTGRHCKKCTRG